MMSDGSIVLIENFAHCGKTAVVVGRKLRHKEDLYEVPCPSSQLNIHFAWGPSELRTWPVTSITCKFFRIPVDNGFAVFPLLHRYLKSSLLFDCFSEL